MDWNQDGHLDILSGCYWTNGEDAGHIQMLAGNGSLDFAAAVPITNVAGNPLQNEALDTTESDSGFAMAKNQTATICTQQHAMDYDGDQDLDLVVGCFANSFYYYENIGDGESIELSDTPVKLPIQSISYHSAPHLVDWDGDGDLDLLSGTASGGAIISENTGTREIPSWSPFKQLIPFSTQSEQDAAAIQPAPSTRVWATDWNRDGSLDLLVGDCASIVEPAEGIDPAIYEQRLATYQKRLADLQAKQQNALMRQQQAAGDDSATADDIQAEIQEISSELQQVYQSRSEFQTTTKTGFVWLFVRKPTAPNRLKTKVEAIRAENSALQAHNEQLNRELAAQQNRQVPGHTLPVSRTDWLFERGILLFPDNVEKAMMGDAVRKTSSPPVVRFENFNNPENVHLDWVPATQELNEE